MTRQDEFEAMAYVRSWRLEPEVYRRDIKSSLNCDRDVMGNRIIVSKGSRPQARDFFLEAGLRAQVVSTAIREAEANPLHVKRFLVGPSLESARLNATKWEKGRSVDWDKMRLVLVGITRQVKGEV